jgi:uncharacterized membrane protein YdjX (TVP38/TMEM64 family)
MEKENSIEKFNKKRKDCVACLMVGAIFFSGICIAFEILSIHFTKLPIVKRNTTFFIAVSVFITLVLLSLALWGIITGKTILYKALFSVFVVLSFFLIILFLIIKTDFIIIFQTPDLYQKFLEKAGGWMPILYIILQFLQVVLLPIPSVVSTLAGVALFGAFKATIYSLMGILLGSFLGFYIGRRLGYRAVSWLVGEEVLSRWLNKLKGKDSLILTITFVLPLFPDDILCFIAGLSTMSFLYFAGMCTISRFLGVIATCYSIELIPFNTWWGLLIWGIIFLVVIIVFIFFYKNLDKITGWLKKKKK